MSVLLAPTFDLAWEAVCAFAVQGIRTVMAAPQGPGDRWTVACGPAGNEMPLFIGEDAWSCNMRTRVLRG